MLNEVLGNITDTIEEMDEYDAYPGASKKDKTNAALAKAAWLGTAAVGSVAAVYGGYKVLKYAYKVTHPILSIFKPF